ncbi:MAG: hypothetical protein AB2660_17280 [Candidatus Thiodiazotropha sp.]
MKEIRTKSTSRVTAEATDIVLRESEAIRLIFRPTILDNRNNLDAAVKGVILYQRKSKKADWEDFETIPLNSVKVGEGYKLELKSAELLLLIQEQNLYMLYISRVVSQEEKENMFRQHHNYSN